MLEFWKPVLRPLLEAASPAVVVEIGTRHGGTTARLLTFGSRQGFVVHSIDPSPGEELDLGDLRNRFGDRFVFHEATSLEALPRIGRIDAVLIDGDHNWYTVHSELKLLERLASEGGHAFPLALLHDVDWPYGRRDLYYDPGAIPDEYRHPYRQAGLFPGQREPSPEGGVNPTAFNAVEENTPRNGVRTAVEDFLAEASEPVEFRSIPGFHGIGILASRARIDASPALAEALSSLDAPPWITEHCARVEHARVWTLARVGIGRQGATGGTPAD